MIQFTVCPTDNGYLQEVKERIIAEARHLFNQFGVRTVRLDDVAHQLGMSKKTLYQHFHDKEELVRLVLETQLEENLREAMAIHTLASNPIVGALRIWTGLRLIAKPPIQICCATLNAIIRLSGAYLRHFGQPTSTRFWLPIFGRA